MKRRDQSSPEQMATLGIVDPFSEQEIVQLLPTYWLDQERRLDGFAGDELVRKVRRHLDVVLQVFALVGNHDKIATPLADRSLNRAFQQDLFAIRDRDVIRASGRIAIEFPNEDEDASLEDGIGYVQLRTNECIVGTVEGLFWEEGIGVVGGELVETPPIAKLDCSDVRLISDGPGGRTSQSYACALVPLLATGLKIERMA